MAGQDRKEYESAAALSYSFGQCRTVKHHIGQCRIVAGLYWTVAGQEEQSKTVQPLKVHVGQSRTVERH